MADPHIISLLNASQEKIEGLISDYEERLQGARRDLASVDCVISFLERAKTPVGEQRTVSISPLFKRGRIFEICSRALQEHPEGLDTRQLSVICLKEAAFDSDSPVLRRGLAQNIKNVLKMRARKGTILEVGKRKGATLWRAKSDGH